MGVVVAFAVLAFASSAGAAVCADYPSQAAAQRAADTRDQDSDGVYCESLPCPCLGPQSTEHRRPQKPAREHRKACVRTRRVVRVEIDRHRYRAVLRHMRRAVRRGWPRVLRINREGADERRDRLLDEDRYPVRRGLDRDEWPMAFARRSWRADVAYVPIRQNRGAGASIGNQLRRYCDGTRFRVVGT